MLGSFHRILKSSAFVLLAAGLLLGAGSADAARRRAEGTVSTTPGTPSGPATPEPAAGLAFALGLGVVVWAVRRNRK